MQETDNSDDGALGNAFLHSHKAGSQSIAFALDCNLQYQSGIALNMWDCNRDCTWKQDCNYD
eukprot:IDg23410t1